MSFCNLVPRPLLLSFPHSLLFPFILSSSPHSSNVPRPPLLAPPLLSTSPHSSNVPLPLFLIPALLSSFLPLLSSSSRPPCRQALAVLTCVTAGFGSTVVLPECTVPPFPRSSPHHPAMVSSGTPSLRPFIIGRIRLRCSREGARTVLPLFPLPARSSPMVASGPTSPCLPSPSSQGDTLRGSVSREDLTALAVPPPTRETYCFPLTPLVLPPLLHALSLPPPIPPGRQHEGQHVTGKDLPAMVQGELNPFPSLPIRRRHEGQRVAGGYGSRGGGSAGSATALPAETHH
ncbi:unnamed protein product [Closterium sp. Naga37s-1]|nr:unnamed protein product [Closterium sp. Naga37s-1]